MKLSVPTARCHTAWQLESTADTGGERERRVEQRILAAA